MKERWLVIRPQQFPISWRVERRVPIVLLVLVALTLVTMILNVSVGEYPIPLLDVFKTIIGWETGNTDYSFIVNNLRLPRALVAVAVGMGLAVSGTILQSLIRNPLATPSIIGVNAGASLAAVVVIVLLPNAPLFAIPISAFGGAIAISLLIYLLAWEKRNSTMYLVLIGIGLNTIAAALTSIMVTFGEINNVSQALIWITGSVNGRSWEYIWPLLPWLLIFLPLAFFLAKDLNALFLGEEVARGLGVALDWRRSLLWLTSVALAAACVATAGAIAFVGFIAPHLGRQLVGNSHEGLIPTAAIIGGFVVILSDLIGRVLVAPTEIPCGIITAIIGAPYFLYLLYRSQK
ncbi:MAG: iron ABC transporter permease [Okeania sp. SIO2G4]|uniref:FecCD family ABC transporter permease n=1 Tax=unclassified Okeania TaxID=2634635 RepID=UPI0013B7EBAD|nr:MULTISPECIES: iron ABC transporter permease [unclassified Okeania]NEP05020.1 iron ABC transporter permease [Okeania sp. SIO4D6]NEP72530.1 iron ABC transporter permease [Okeania sp. SIO2G5]NEP95486.1 iron ABC transporter permease [Okeania sp. SIO2F5]NEQ91239.1 iron ABC transporter permease [Okeania sp. SIO2G4]